MAPLIPSNTAERGFAQVAERLAPQAGALPGPLVESGKIPTPVLMIEKRDDSPDATHVPVVNPPPTSVKALAGIIVFLGIVVLIVATWKLRSWLRRRKAAKNPAMQSDCESPLPEKIMSEKRNSLYKRTTIDLPYGSIQPLTKARLLPTPPVFNPEVSWVPQVRSVNGDPFASPYDVGTRALVDASSKDRTAASKQIQPPKPTARRESRLSKVSMMVRPPKSRPASLTTIALFESASSLAERPPTPKVTRKKSSRPLPPLKPKLPGITPVPPVPAINVLEPSLHTCSSSSSIVKEQLEAVDEQPIVSPRRVDSCYGSERGRVSIFTRRQSTASRHSRNLSVPDVPPMPSDFRVSSASTSGTYTAPSAPKRLPRLVTVVHIFTPSMEDELPIKIGEVLRLNNEFKDGWCSVQRVGKVDAEEGVVPQFCLQDRPDIIPTSKSTYSMRTSRSYLTSMSSFSLGTPPR